MVIIRILNRRQIINPLLLTVVIFLFSLYPFSHLRHEKEVDIIFSNNIRALLGLFYDKMGSNKLKENINVPTQTNINVSTCLPVIPGAAGFGMETPAGRGGEIYKVTNLNDSGPGSLRRALEAENPRIVVFEVSGTIDLDRRIEIKSPFITIAGQTAPSSGIWIRGNIIILTHDILIQHLTIRCGESEDYSDPISIGYYGGFPTYNIVIDHVSFGWGWDEALEMRTIDDLDGGITLRNVIISHGLHNSIHEKGSHGYGPLLRGRSKVSMYGSFIAHHSQRLPLSSTSLFLADNVFYNRLVRFTSLGGGDSDGDSTIKHFSITSNVYIDKDSAKVYFPTEPIHVRNNEFLWQDSNRLYVADNFVNHEKFGSTISDWDLVSFIDPLNDNIKDFRVNDPPIWPNGYETIKDHQAIIQNVYENAGSRPADRSEYDEKLFEDFFARKGQIVDCVEGCDREIGSWPIIEENIRSLQLPDNLYGDDDGDGYQNVEEYLYQMALRVEGRQEGNQAPLISLKGYLIDDQSIKLIVDISNFSTDNSLEIYRTNESLENFVLIDSYNTTSNSTTFIDQTLSQSFDTICYQIKQTHTAFGDIFSNKIEIRNLARGYVGFLYPSPAQESLFIRYPLGIIRVEIYDLNGRLVLTDNYESGQINLSLLSKGTYITKVYGEESVKNFILLKQ